MNKGRASALPTKKKEMRTLTRHSDTIYAILTVVLIAIVTLNIKL